MRVAVRRALRAKVARHLRTRHLPMSLARLSADTEVDAAIARVLAAENAARACVADVERECAARVEDARAAARATGERAERRIRVARERFEANVAREVERLHTQAESLAAPRALDDADARAVDAAVARMAAILTGGTP